MNSLEYWRKRETEAKKKYITDENAYAKEIQAMYLRTLDRVQKEIDSFYTRYAAKEGITIADAKKRADKLDMGAYAAKAKKYVKNRDFSKQANDEMRLYNLTMKVNRLELLKANIGLELVQQSEDLQQFMDEKLTGRTMEELQRQAGILGESISDEAKVAKRIVNASFHNATFSERIWQNHTLLKADLAKQLEIGLIQGKHPTVLARDLRKTWDVSQYQALRLMRTELARVQIDAQMQSYDNAGVTEYTYITCGFGDACPVCRALDGQHFKTSDMLPGENAPPMHPNCHCSTSAYVDRNSIDWLKESEEEANNGKK